MQRVRVRQAVLLRFKRKLARDRIHANSTLDHSAVTQAAMAVEIELGGRFRASLVLAGGLPPVADGFGRVIDREQQEAFVPPVRKTDSLRRNGRNNLRYREQHP